MVTFQIIFGWWTTQRRDQSDSSLVHPRTPLDPTGTNSKCPIEWDRGPGKPYPWSLEIHSVPARTLSMPYWDPAARSDLVMHTHCENAMAWEATDRLRPSEGGDLVEVEL